MKRLCVIGDPIGHSKSPLIQNAMIKAFGLDYEYTAVRVPGDQTAGWLARARAEGWAGFNATMPHKENLVPLMDELDPLAARCGAVNTVALREGRAFGYNTDAPGFLNALADLGVDPAGKAVLVLGSGGAAKAVSAALAGAGARVTVANRTRSKAEAVCRMDPDHIRPAGFATEELCKLSERADLLVNCTSLGMAGTDHDYEDLSFLDRLPRGAAVCDAIYAPPETTFLGRARELGHPTMNGLGMLVGQAIFALEHFVGSSIDRETAKKAALEVLKEYGL